VVRAGKLRIKTADEIALQEPTLLSKCRGTEKPIKPPLSSTQVKRPEQPNGLRVRELALWLSKAMSIFMALSADVLVLHHLTLFKNHQ